MAAYWITASIPFANLTVAIARSLTNTLSGIRPIDLPGFIVVQLLGAVWGFALSTWLFHYPRTSTNPWKSRRSHDRRDPCGAP
jgi:hypothetical protein